MCLPLHKRHSGQTHPFIFMKRIFGHILFLSILTLAAGCTETVVIEDTSAEASGTGIPILFSSDTQAMPESKSQFEPDNINTVGNSIMVYDIHTTDTGSDMYIDGAEATYDGTDWKYDPVKYWTHTGTHSFTAYSYYNSTDKVQAPDATYNRTDESIVIPGYTITAANQFDFMYAYETRSMNEQNPYRPVELDMQHLFAAVQFNVVNTAYINGQNNDGVRNIRFISFSLGGIHDTGSATVTPDASPTITLGGSSPSSLFSRSRTADENVILEHNQAYNVYSSLNNGSQNGADKYGEDGFILIWPHTIADFSGATATLTYQMETWHYNWQTGGYWEWDNPVSVKFNLASKGDVNNWRAGRKYIYNINIHDNRISFSVKVVPWIEDEIILDER